MAHARFARALVIPSPPASDEDLAQALELSCSILVRVIKTIGEVPRRAAPRLGMTAGGAQPDL